MPTKLDAAYDLLRRELRHGSMPTVHVEAVAQRLGISVKTLKRARRDLHIEATKGPNGGWFLSLPTDNDLFAPMEAEPCRCPRPTLYLDAEDQTLTCAKCGRASGTTDTAEVVQLPPRDVEPQRLAA